MKWIVFGVVEVSALTVSIVAARPGMHWIVAALWFAAVVAAVVAVSGGDQ